jgi:type IV pilus assembly protein PilQ
VRVAAAATLLTLLASPPARAEERDACVRGTRWRGHTIDLDLKAVPLHDVFRLLSDVGRINVVVGDDVKGAVTLRLKKVPWDQALCTIARTKQLRVTADGNVYLITPAATARSP